MAAQHTLVTPIELLSTLDEKHVGQNLIALSELSKNGFLVPPGFVITAHAQELFFKENKLLLKIKHLLGTVNFENVDSLSQVSFHIQKLIISAGFPDTLQKEIFSAYKKTGLSAAVSVNGVIIEGEAVFLVTLRKLWAESYSPKALHNLYVLGKDVLPYQYIPVQKVISGITGRIFTKPDASNRVRIELDLGKTFFVQAADMQVTEGEDIELSERQLRSLATCAVSLSKHVYMPSVVDFVVDQDNTYVASINPQTESSFEEYTVVVPQEVDEIQMFTIGEPVVPGIGIGPVKIYSVASRVTAGHVLVSEAFHKDIIPHIKKAKALVLGSLHPQDRSSVLDLGIPTIVVANEEIQNLTEGLNVQINATTGHITVGDLQAQVAVNTEKTATRIYGYVKNKAEAISSDGLFINGTDIIKALKKHPKKEGVGKEVTLHLASKLSQLSKAAFPKPIYYMLSSLSAHEYLELEHGKDFEKLEKNPKIGYKGAARHLGDLTVLKAELDAIKSVRQKFSNVSLVLPFVRSPQELELLLHVIHDYGLSRSHTFHVYLSVETPGNAILISQLIDKGINGIFVNIDTLTELTLAVDRDNEDVGHSFDASNQAILWSIARIAEAARDNNIPCGVFGERLEASLIKTLLVLGISALTVPVEDVEPIRSTVRRLEQELLDRVGVYSK